VDLLLPNVSDRYKSASQIARIATESWTTENLTCPFCSDRLMACPNNTRSRDLDCTACHEQFQLKSYSGTKKTRLIGAEYRTTIECIRAGDHPSMIIMRYDADTRSVVDLHIIHRSNITASCVLPRKRLSADAKRAGWQGCIFDLCHEPPYTVPVACLKERPVCTTQSRPMCTSRSRAICTTIV
jgi:type II restriction enzyme